MPKLNEHRIVKRRNGFFITTKKAYERFKETGECIYKY